jgi:hypothetical protein
VRNYPKGHAEILSPRVQARFEGQVDVSTRSSRLDGVEEFRTSRDGPRHIHAPIDTAKDEQMHDSASERDDENVSTGDLDALAFETPLN